MILFFPFIGTLATELSWRAPVEGNEHGVSGIFDWAIFKEVEDHYKSLDNPPFALIVCDLPNEGPDARMTPFHARYRTIESVWHRGKDFATDYPICTSSRSPCGWAFIRQTEPPNKQTAQTRPRPW